MPDVVLVSMPFGPVFAPSIGLSLLQTELAEKHLSARIQYFTIRFAERIGQAFYSGIANGRKPVLTDLAGEWIFSRALFDTGPDDEARYVKDTLEEFYSTALIDKLLRVRHDADAFLDDCLEAILRERPKIVGFTSVFQQHTASLALARRIKRVSPATFIVFGGANCEGVMGAETVRSFPFVDAAVSGEADLIAATLVRRVLDGVPIADLPGVRTRARIDREFAINRFDSAPIVREMDCLPIPDYRDYFEQFKASRYERTWQPSIFFETSRGCWWGERMHCTFCGLNGETMAFRSKTAGRALDELTEMVRRHPKCRVQVVDNILDMRYFKDFLPALVDRGLNARLFYETKSNLRKDQVRLLRDAGVGRIQPGIESFSDSVLKLMRKGVSALHNIQLLKWCQELGVEPCWNFIWGFPGEDPAEYARMARLVPFLTHLPPPVGHDEIRLDRFSPNFFDAERLGFAAVAPLAAYAHVYPLPDEAVANLACYFTFSYQEPRDVDAYARPLARELTKWRRVSDRSDLVSVDTGDDLRIVDLRPVAARPVTVLAGVDRILYQRCDAICDLSQLADAASAIEGSIVSAASIEDRLAPLVEQGLVLRAGTRYLALAIPVGEYAPRRGVRRRFARAIRKIAEGSAAGRCGRESANGQEIREERTRSDSARREEVEKEDEERGEKESEKVAAFLS